MSVVGEFFYPDIANLIEKYKKEMEEVNEDLEDLKDLVLPLGCCEILMNFVISFFQQDMNDGGILEAGECMDYYDIMVKYYGFPVIKYEQLYNEDFDDSFEFPDLKNAINENINNYLKDKDGDFGNVEEYLIKCVQELREKGVRALFCVETDLWCQDMDFNFRGKYFRFYAEENAIKECINDERYGYDMHICANVHPGDEDYEYYKDWPI